MPIKYYEKPCPILIHEGPLEKDHKALEKLKLKKNGLVS